MISRASGASPRTVVVTGMGCVTPVGNDVLSFWSALLEGRQGARPVRSFDTSPYRTSVGCEVVGLDDPTQGGDPVEASVARTPDDRRPRKPTARRATQLALQACREALRQADLDPFPMGLKLGLSLGSTMGEPSFLDEITPRGGVLLTPDEDLPWEELRTHGGSTTTACVARALGLRGIQASLPAACSAGNYAIGLALDLVRSGEADALLAGGTEAFSESAFAGFQRLGAMSPDLCRPFDRDRQGLLLGEGAGVLVLEAEEHALLRGARPLARVRGYGLSCDAHHITGPHPQGQGAQRAMEAALADAAAERDEVDYVCCHGTGTLQNDRIEAKALGAVFGERAGSLPASSVKAITGHMMGAASAVESIACVLALQHGLLPPTWNHRALDPECALDVIPNEPRPRAARLVLNNSYAFGGNNACVAFGWAGPS